MSLHIIDGLSLSDAQWVAFCSEDERSTDADIEYRDGKYVVAGVVACLTLEAAQELAAA